MKNVACQISKQRRSQNPTVSPEGTPVLPWWLSWLRVCLQCRRPRFYPWVGKNPCRREWQPTPVFLPGKFQGQRSLVGYCPWGHKESDTTEQVHTLWVKLKYFLMQTSQQSERTASYRIIFILPIQALILL